MQQTLDFNSTKHEYFNHRDGGSGKKKNKTNEGTGIFTLTGNFWIDSPAMAKVKNAMFFTVKESCIKLAAGYGNTEINDRLNMYRHV